MDYLRTLNRLAKWRAHYAGWMLGTRLKDDPECQAVRDLFEKLLLLRAEASAQTALMISKGICTAEEFTNQLEEEAKHLMRALEEAWPGARAGDDGMHYDLKTVRVAGWQRNWKP